MYSNTKGWYLIQKSFRGVRGKSRFDGERYSVQPIRLMASSFFQVIIIKHPKVYVADIETSAY